MEPGSDVTYTLHATNTSDAVVDGATVTDDLSAVLDDATLDTAGLPAGVTFDATTKTLTWTVPHLGAGEQASASYTVTVGAHAWGATLHNVATPHGQGGECATEGGCETTHTTPEVTTLELTKVDFETGDTLAGAVFQLYDDTNGNEALDAGEPTHGAPVTSDEDGMAAWSELRAGHYLVTETKAPEGYSIPSHPVVPVLIGETGGTVQLTYHDPAQGQLALLPKQQLERTTGGGWAESDGVVDFGDEVRYVIPVKALGPKLFHDVTLTDYVPGFNPDDTVSTGKTSYVTGSAKCVDVTCTVDVDRETGLITWSLGTVSDATGSVEFVVRFPAQPDPLPATTDGTYTAVAWNQAYLAWKESVTEGPATGAGEGDLPTVDHELASNEVQVKAEAEVLGEEGGRPRPRPTIAGVEASLPGTGGPWSGLVWSGAALVLAGCGLLLTTRRRRQQD